jgi:hypothetical protein
MAQTSPLAALAEQWYQQYLPQAYDGMSPTERATFFGTLGEQAAQEIEQVSEALAGDDPPNETFEEKAGRLNAARAQATELVMRQTLLALLPPDWPETNGYPDQATPDPQMPPTPDATDVNLAEAMAEFSDAASELAQQKRDAARASQPTLPAKPEYLSSATAE